MLLSAKGVQSPYTIYDPFCGVAYALTVLGFFHGADIKAIFASDIDENVLSLARKNLSLLSKDGLHYLKTKTRKHKTPLSLRTAYENPRT